MLPTPDARKIPWESLRAAFRDFEADPEWLQFSSQAFEAALICPELSFVSDLLRTRAPREPDRPSATRTLYAFLLDQRYAQKLNLLYFAFDVFGENSSLPPDVVARTPYPHEDGVPAFRYAVRGPVHGGCAP